MEKTEAQLLARAVAIAAQAHQDQLDKAGQPYILHPIRMMLRAESVKAKMVAVLHDVVEDSPWTPERLAAEGFAPDVLEAVDKMTRRTREKHGVEEPYDEFIERVLTDPLATEVKFLDLEDNMILTRLSALTPRDLERVQRYHRAHRRLLEARAAAAR